MKWHHQRLMRAEDVNDGAYEPTLPLLIDLTPEDTGKLLIRQICQSFHHVQGAPCAPHQAGVPIIHWRQRGGSLVDVCLVHSGGSSTNWMRGLLSLGESPCSGKMVRAP